MNYRLQITNYKLQITNYKLQITNYPPEAPPKVDSPQAKDPPLADKLFALGGEIF